MGKAGPDDSISLSNAMCFVGSTVISVINEVIFLFVFGVHILYQREGTIL
jgi:hypothetical protein